jgi:regulator of nucleoside diphosphate kinase
MASFTAKGRAEMAHVMITQSDRERLLALLTRLRNWGNTPTEHLLALEERLQSAAVVGKSDIPESVVTMNSLVGLRDVQFNEKFSRTLSYPEEADVVRQKVSVTVPLGNQMLGAHEGDLIKYAVSSGLRALRVERVYYQPEAAGDFHL